jgi:sigma-B regulation protein RsbU (phosphoserine phosphatase)
MHQIRCAEVWGGIKNEDVDACSTMLTTSLYSSACDGGKGGDIYYVSVCQGDMLTRVTIADVVGHGEKVSRVSQWLYESLNARMNDSDGTAVLSDLNTLATERGLEALTTAATVGFYSADGHAHFAYAGHFPMLLKRAGERDWRPVRVAAGEDEVVNLPLGLTAEMRYTQGSTPVGSGDRALLYTDGVIETPSPGGELFGQQRLERALAEVGDRSLYEVKTAVLDRLRDFAGGELGHDDVTLLAIEMR